MVLLNVIAPHAPVEIKNNAPIATKSIMKEETKVESTEEVVPTTTEEQVPPQEETDPVKAELERVAEKPKRSKKDQLLYTKQRVEQQLAELDGKDPNEVAKTISDDDKPLTRRDVEQLFAERELDTAVELAEDIEDDNERKLTQHYLENVIKPSGDAKTDLRNAQLMVNAVKNKQITEEVARTATVRRHASTASAPAKETPRAAELSKEDEAVARGFGLTPEEVQKAVK